MMQIIIYTKSGCPNCVTAKRLLKSKGLEWAEYSIEQHGDKIAGVMAHYPDARQMPQIFIEGQRVGGLAGLQAALKELGV